MKACVWFSSVAFVLLTAVPLAAQSQDLDTFARSFIERHRIPGAAIAVVQNGRIVKSGAYGIANLEHNTPVTDKTVFEIGSISKQFAAEAIMMLVEDGRVTLADPLAKYVVGIPDAWRAITLGHLITHTSGVADWESRPDFSYRREYTPAEFIALVAKYPLDFTPGDRYAYTNSGFPLLGLVLERVTGQKYEDFVTERIFKRAGMTDTRFKHFDAVVPRRSGGYVDQNGVLVNGEPLRPGIIAPNGGIMTTATDMAKWLIALESGVLLKPATVAQMTAPIHLNDGTTWSAGAAWFIDRFRGHRVLLHNGSTVAGFSSVVVWYPEDHVGAVALMNIDRWNDVNVLATRAAGAYLPGISHAMLTEQPDPDPAFTRKLLTLLEDVAARRDNELLGPNLHDAAGKSRANPDFGFSGTPVRFAFLDREDLGSAGIEKFGNRIRWVYHYRLVPDKGHIRDYLFDITTEGKIARFFPEQQ